MVTPHLPWKFHANRSSCFLTMLLTKKQRKKSPENNTRPHNNAFWRLHWQLIILAQTLNTKFELCYFCTCRLLLSLSNSADSCAADNMHKVWCWILAYHSLVCYCRDAVGWNKKDRDGGHSEGCVQFLSPCSPMIQTSVISHQISSFLQYMAWLLIRDECKKMQNSLSVECSPCTIITSVDD